MNDELELLNQLLQEEGIFRKEDQVQVQPAQAGPSPLSLEQHRLWFLYELAPHSSAYNISSSFYLDGALNQAALLSSFKTIVQRHDVLRISFRDVDGQPLQFVEEAIDLPVQILDWRSLAHEDLEAEIASLAKQEAHFCFDLRTGPLFRVTLLQYEEHRYALFLTLHHIIADAWSLGIFVREFTALYSAYCLGRQTSLPPLRVQYSDYAAWQRQSMHGEVIAKQLAYWKEKLAGLTVQDFPTDFPRPKLQTFRGGLVSFGVPAGLSADLAELSRRQRTTLFVTLMSAFHVLLARYTSQNDIAVGTSFANRSDQDMQVLIGFFVNMLVIRTDLSGDPTFLEILEQANTTILEAFENSFVPYEKLVEHIDPPRNTSRNPLFQVAFTMLNAPSPELNLDGLRITPMGTQDAARFDLEFFIRESAEGLSGTISYSSDIFLPETMERLANSYIALLDGIVRNPHLSVSRFPLFITTDLITVDEPVAKFAVTECLHQHFEKQAQLRPAALALKFDDQEMSYGELNARANCLAHQFIARGVGPDTLVGLLVERSFFMVVGILGILKAGAAYVPLDPSYPSERFHYMVDDSQLAIVVTCHGLEHLLGSCPAEVVILEDALETIDESYEVNPVCAATPANLAYVIYTSGSTGRPKGVLVTHANVCRLMSATADQFHFDAKDIWTLFHSYAFDFSVWEIWGALLFGGRLIIVPKLITRSPEDFYALLCEEKVTILNQTPTAFRQLIQAEERVGRESEITLRYVIFGGEALDLSHLEPWMDRHGDEYPVLVNMYGITETTVHVTFRRIELRDVKTRAGSVIGKPIDDLQMYLLDDHFDVVPRGAIGEIFVGGDGVSRGYLNRPELTAARFIPNAFSAIPGERLYRSGDLSRILPNGDFEYHGRADNQIKIRGFRIEPGEIEAVISKHPGVQETVVLSRKTASGESLIAYVIPRLAGKFQAKAEKEIWQEKQIARWNETFDDTYGATSNNGDKTFDLSGWNSSYDGRPIPESEMRMWLQETVHAIQELHPKIVLEIGCGTGMLMFQIAPLSDQYVATDFSHTTLERFAGEVSMRGWKQVQLESRRAHDFTGIPRGVFDTIIINSVIQYFPSVDYLLDVLTQCIDIAKPDAAIYIGDIRSLPLLDAYHASVELYKAPTEMSRREFKDRVARAREREEELVVDEQFFLKLQLQFPQITDVQVHLKSSSYHNELTKFRYDVILSLGSAEPASDVLWDDWRPGSLTSEVLNRLSKTERSDIWGIRNIPNSRLLQERRVLEWMESTEDPDTVGAFLKREERELRGSSEPGLDPSTVHRWAEEANLRCLLTWSIESSAGAFDVCFWAPSTDRSVRIARDLPSMLRSNSWDQFANHPLKEAYLSTLAPALREHAMANLPDYMVPADVVLIDRLPLTPSGKLDRASLPLPGTDERNNNSSFVAPQTDLENRVATLWAEVLGIKRVGLEDNFFQLGGHSLLATQLIAKVRSAFSIDLSLRILFEYPTLSSFCGKIEMLMPEQTVRHEQIVPCIRRSLMPLSFAQQNLWLQRQIADAGGAYNISVAFDLVGTLNLVALEHSLAAIEQRHEILRTVYLTENDNPVQFVKEGRSLVLEIQDLSSLLEEAQEEKVEQLLSDVASRSFDLSKGPVWRALLIRCSPQRHVLVLAIHHIACDGWSIGILAHELAALYHGFKSQRSSILKELPLQYIDFAGWQRQWLTGPELDRQLAFWKTYLSGAPPFLHLLTDRPRPATQSFKGQYVPFSIDPELYSELQAFAGQTKTTVYMLLLAAFALTLSRNSAATDIVIGSPVANRNSQEWERLIGFFVNTLALRMDLSGDPDVLQYINEVKNNVLNAFSNQDAPFDLVVRHLNPTRNLSHSPLFQVMFVWQNLPTQTLGVDELSLQPRPVQTEVAKFDLTVILEEGANNASGVFEYNTDLFDRRTIERLSHHFLIAVEQIVRHPRKHISELSFLTPEERWQVLEEWNATASDRLDSLTVHKLIEQRVSESPNSSAVLFQGESLSYLELNKRANQLAHWLRESGVGPEAIVGLCAEPSFEMIVGLLGILKAGGAYLPLDPSYPSERLALMVKDAGVSLILTHKAALLNWPDQRIHSIRTICLNENWEDIATRSQENPEFAIDSANLAYVIYTSGSTGVPKGVAVEHRNLVNSTWARMTYYPEPVSCFLLLSSFSFDSSIAGIFGTLCQGGSLLLVPAGDQKDLKAITDLISHSSVSHLLSLPSLYGILLSYVRASRLCSLKTVIVAGEVCMEDLVVRHFDSLPACSLYNEYGPTEGTVWATVYRMLPGRQYSRVPIGRPISNAKLYVVDQQMNPTPIGVPGQLCIGGAGVARGYLNRPESTAEKFIPDPFSRDTGARLYQTGDLVAYLPDGNIDFLGRTDRQIKIRGFRIEIDEIETVLHDHPGIRRAAVVTAGEKIGDLSLVAFVSFAHRPAPSDEELRKHLEQRLPHYMVPSTFVHLEDFPVLPNGKVDRNQLQSRSMERASIRGTSEAPRTPLEKQLGAIWARLLNLEDVGIHDNFFDAGGHSLLAIRLMAEIDRSFGVVLPIASLFRAGTIADMAAEITAQVPAVNYSGVVPIHAEGELPNIFLVHDVSGQILSYYPLAVRLKSHHPVYAISAWPVDEEKGNTHSVAAMAASYIQEIRAVQPTGPYMLAGHSAGATIALEMVRQLQDDGEPSCLIVLDANAPLPDASFFEYPENDADLLIYTLQTLGIYFGQESPLDRQELDSLTLAQAFDLILVKIREGRFPAFVASAQQMAEMFSIYKSNIAALRSYQWRGSINAPIYLWSAQERTVAAGETPDRGWNKTTSGGVIIFDAQGDHITMLKEPNVTAVANQLLSVISDYEN